MRVGKRLQVLIALGLLVVAGTLLAKPELEWHADTAHSSIQFKNMHWHIVDVIGWFEDFEVSVFSDRDDFTDATIDVRIRAESVRMPNPAMAANLRNLFFEIEKYPVIRFRSTNVDMTRDSVYAISGDLTMRGITKKIELVAKFHGFAYPPNGVPGFTVHGGININDFGLGEADSLPSHLKPDISDQVYFTGNIRLDYGPTPPAKSDADTD